MLKKEVQNKFNTDHNKYNTFPRNFHIELTFGCNNKCKMCYKQVLTKKSPEYMPITLAKTIAQKIKTSNPRKHDLYIKFALRGEPTLNPNWLEITKIFHKELPYATIVIFTNGNTLTNNKIKQYFKNGGTLIYLDCYNNTYNTYKNKFKQFNIYDWYTTQKTMYNIKPEETPAILLIDDIQQRSGELNTRILTNMAGNSQLKKPLKKPLNQPCLRPFRDITIFYNGTIPVCCSDASIQYKLGQIQKIQNLQQWYTTNKKLQQIKKQLTHGQRKTKPCTVCDYNGL